MKGVAIGNLLSVTDARLGTVKFFSASRQAPKNHKFDVKILGTKINFYDLRRLAQKNDANMML
jgi:hypothetical protein